MKFRANFSPLNARTMFFDQVIGSGANAFILIITVVVGFVSALSFIDSKKTMKENEQNEPFEKK